MLKEGYKSVIVVLKSFIWEKAPNLDNETTLYFKLCYIQAHLTIFG